MKVKQLEDKDGFKVFELEPGRTVLCDWSCAKDWTDRTESGGILFQSKAVCPDCTPDLLRSVKAHGEEEFIRGRCPEGMSFADWIRSMR